MIYTTLKAINVSKKYSSTKLVKASSPKKQCVHNVHWNKLYLITKW